MLLHQIRMVDSRYRRELKHNSDFVETPKEDHQHDYLDCVRLVFGAFLLHQRGAKLKDLVEMKVNLKYPR
jgi:hypothetical protein